MRPNLLIVDDDELAAVTLRDVALEFGFREAEIARGAQEALDRLDSLRPDAMTLDINLHGRKSYEVAARAVRLGIPFVFLSGYDRNDIPLEYLKIPVLEKPCGGEALRRVLSELAHPLDGPGLTLPRA
ncbi:response regulator [Azospirillum sp. sgz302134]